MKVHIFKDENVYVLSLLDFLGRNFDLSEHRFIFRSKITGKTIPVDESQVQYLPGIINLFKINSITKKASKVYFHLLPSGPDLLFWYFHRSVFKKSAWIYWGADVYAYRKENLSITNYINQKMRRDIIPMIPEIGGFLVGDFNIIKQIYNTKATYRRVFYPIPTDFDLCDAITQEAPSKNTGTLTILAGNSGNETNHHLKLFDILGKYKNQNIQILCPLSYGAKDSNYTTTVIEKGYSIFGEKFKPLLTFINPKDYISLLNTVDIAVMNHDRQQGMSSTLTLLYLGKKVFLNEKVVSFEYLIGNNISVYKISSIDSLPFKEFVKFNREDGLKNKEILSNEFSETTFKLHWKEFLDL